MNSVATNQCAVIVNAIIDPLEVYESQNVSGKRSRNDSAFDAIQNELCIMKHNTQISSERILSSAVKVITFANRFLDKTSEDTDYDKYTFVGFAVNDSKNGDTFAVQCGGVRTIINTGPDSLKCGDTIMWSFPSSSDQHNRTKKCRKQRQRAILVGPASP